MLKAQEKRLQAIQEERKQHRHRLKTSYLQTLETQLQFAREQGDLDHLEAIQDEMKRAQIGFDPPPDLSEFTELAHMQEILTTHLYQLDQQHARQVKQLYERLDELLALLQQDLVRQGQIESARELVDLRKEKQNEPDAIWSRENAPSPSIARTDMTPATSPSATEHMDIQKARHLFKGRVISYNPINQEIEIHYDFSDPEQLTDFDLTKAEHFQVKDGQLHIHVPAGTDWWAWAKPRDLTGPYLLIPYLQPENSSLKIDCIAIQSTDVAAHFTIGYSNLQEKTVGIGPHTTQKVVKVEGWTVSEPTGLRNPGQRIPIRFPITLEAIRRGNDVEFSAISRGRRVQTTLKVTPELLHLGLFPKAWSEQPNTAIFDNLRVKGQLKQ